MHIQICVIATNASTVVEGNTSKTCKNGKLQCHVPSFYRYFNSSSGLLHSLAINKVLVVFFKAIQLLLGALEKQNIITL